MSGSLEHAAALAQSLSDEHFRLLVENVREDALFLLDVNGRVMSWNPGAQRIFGYAAEDIIGSHHSCFYSEEDLAFGKPERMLASARSEGSSRVEGWAFRSDRRRFWAVCAITALQGQDGKERGFAQITRDDTVRHETAEELRQSEELFRLLVGGLKEHGVYMLDCQGMVTSWNEGAQRIKQYRSDEIIGRSFENFFTKEDRDAGHPRQELELAAARGMAEGEGWRVRKDGSRFWASVVVTALRADDGSLRGFAKVTREETVRHDAGIALQQALERATAAETQLQVHNAELETRVQERTAQLSSQAQDLLRVNDELKQFNFIASHDLQEPLRTITSFCGRLSTSLVGVADQEVLADMELVIDAARRMKQLILDLLTYGRAQNHIGVFVEMSLGEVLSEALANLQVSISESAATIEIEGLPQLVADRRLMTQLLQNLVGNALKYRGDIAPVIRITGRRLEGAWEVAVSDNGIGIAERHQQRVFQLFKRLHTPKRYSGTGLGLALCKLIVERHGGRIWIESGPPVPGTRFLFTIPDLSVPATTTPAEAETPDEV
jgi:PAS domain S-box-containing protein